MKSRYSKQDSIENYQITNVINKTCKKINYGIKTLLPREIFLNETILACNKWYWSPLQTLAQYDAASTHAQDKQLCDLRKLVLGVLCIWLECLYKFKWSLDYFFFTVSLLIIVWNLVINVYFIAIYFEVCQLERAQVSIEFIKFSMIY